jgi:hypothetical protein
MVDYYKPEPFPPPFPADFDPRENLYEVVGVEASGTIKVTSSRGQFLSVPASNVAVSGLPAVGERLLGEMNPGKQPGVFGRLFGDKERSGPPSLRLAPLRPHPLELQFVERWLQSLREGGLHIEGVDAARLLEKRLREAPLGSRRPAPLRRVLRELLEEWVGRFPQRDESWGVEDVPSLCVEVGEDGLPHPLSGQDLDDDFEPTVLRESLPEEVRVSFVEAPMAIPESLEELEHLTRIGGAPSWIQGAMPAGSCPRCSVPMRFVAQFADPPEEMWAGEAGMFYVFGCDGCRVVASFVQTA